jgi:aspartate racemase
VPEAGDRERLHAIIYDELCQGVIRSESRDEVVAIIARGQAAGADGIIFGCTEIGLLIDGRSSPLPCFDTTELHAALNTSRAPLNTLHAPQLCPGSAALERINATLR